MLQNVPVYNEPNLSSLHAQQSRPTLYNPHLDQDRAGGNTARREKNPDIPVNITGRVETVLSCPSVAVTSLTTPWTGQLSSDLNVTVEQHRTTSHSSVNNGQVRPGQARLI